MIPTLAIDPGVLKIVTHLAWENILNPIICVGASRSYPFLFVCHYALLVASNNGFYAGERCRPQSSFMDCLFLMCMASILPLFQYPMVMAWTLAAPQLM